MSAEPNIIRVDDNLVVVNKPSGIPTTPSGQRKTVSLLEWTKAQLPTQSQYLHPTSRLDAEVSGLVLMSRNHQTTVAIADARRCGNYLRRYIAIVHGVVDPQEDSWRWPVIIHPKDKRMRQASDNPTVGKAALTKYRMVAYSSCESFSVLDLFPHTGRTHQLRLHAQRAGHCIAGDRQYGVGRRITLTNGSVIAVPRVMLHCYRVQILAAPRLNELSFVAPVPEIFTKVWTELGGNQLFADHYPH